MHANARIEPGVADVGNELRQQHQRDRNDRARQQKVDVVVACRVDQRLAEAGALAAGRARVARAKGIRAGSMAP